MKMTQYEISFIPFRINLLVKRLHHSLYKQHSDAYLAKINTSIFLLLIQKLFLSYRNRHQCVFI